MHWVIQYKSVGEIQNKNTGKLFFFCFLFLNIYFMFKRDLYPQFIILSLRGNGTSCDKVVYLSLSNTWSHYSIKLYCVIVLLLLLCSLVGT